MKSKGLVREYNWGLFPAPIGWVGVVAAGEGLVGIGTHPNSDELRRRLLERYPEAVPATDGLTGRAIGQLQEYFGGARRVFDLPLDFRDLSVFSVTILRALCEVPFGRTVSYGELAKRCGAPKAARAVGRVMAANPFPLVVPCHRVVGTSGKLVGYSGGKGLPTKEWLLQFEVSKVADAG
jgi:methylated-DNA-[protein]-cysteine S-methyltransferase